MNEVQSLRLQRVTQVDASITSVVRASPSTSVIAPLGVNCPVAPPLAENSKKSGTPGTPTPVGPKAVAVNTYVSLQLSKYWGLGDRDMRATGFVAVAPQQ